MKFNGSKILHCVLIIVMVFAPLRFVLAAPCHMESPDMHAMQASSGHAAMHHADKQGHHMSAMHAAGSMHQDMNKHCCCHDCKNNCSGNCDLGVSQLLPQHDSHYSPVYEGFIKPVTVISEILFRELTPPSRPPATLHS
jgi:hypothetical protein